MATKSSGAPSGLTWSQGDMEQNSGASANGVAAWVNVAAGTPGTWAGIPLGNSAGQIAPSQISSTTGSGSVVLATSPTVASPTFTGAITTPLATAGLATVASGGVLGSEAQVTVAQGGTGAASTLQDYVFAGPTSGTGAPGFRALVSGDIPNNAANTTGTAASVTGTVGAANGGVGAASLTGYLYGNGSSAATASTTIPVSALAATVGSGSVVLATSPTVASPTFTGAITTPLATAGLATVASGGVLGSEAQVTVAQGGTGAASTLQDYVFAGPTSGTGAPGFRALVSGDIPNNAANTTGTAASVTGTVGAANGGLGAASLTGYLYGNGSSAATASTTIPVSALAATVGSGSVVLATSPTVASPTFTGAITTPLATAGLATVASGGVLGSEAQVTVAQGGTGAASTLQDYVFAGPTSGTGAP